MKCYVSICKGLCIYYVRVHFASLRWRLTGECCLSGPGASLLRGAGGKIAEITRSGPRQKYGRSQAGCGITRVTGHYSAKYEYIRESFSVSLAT